MSAEEGGMRVFRIGEFSKMSKTTVKTLHYYDAVGLLKPEQVDAFTGYRMYTTDQLLKLHRIQAFRQAGLTIEEILSIGRGQDIRRVLSSRLQELADEQERITAQRSRIEFILSGQEEALFMKYQAIVKELPACVVYAKKLTVPSYDAYFELVPAIGETVAAANPDIKCATPEYCFIRYLDGEYREKDFHVEFCEAVDRFGNEVDGITFREEPAATAVCVMHKGAYSGLSAAYAYAFKWIEENQYETVDCPRESYIDGIWNKEDEADWLTELQIPVKRR